MELLTVSIPIKLITVLQNLCHHPQQCVTNITVVRLIFLSIILGRQFLHVTATLASFSIWLLTYEKHGK